MSRLVPIALSAALLLASPDAARACAVCTGGSTEEVRYAFLWTTGFLSLLPLCLVGGLVWFLRRRARELAAPETGREIGLADGPPSRALQPRETGLSRTASSR